MYSLSFSSFLFSSFLSLPPLLPSLPPSLPPSLKASQGKVKGLMGLKGQLWISSSADCKWRQATYKQTCILPVWGLGPFISSWSCVTSLSCACGMQHYDLQKAFDSVQYPVWPGQNCGIWPLIMENVRGTTSLQALFYMLTRPRIGQNTFPFCESYHFEHFVTCHTSDGSSEVVIDLLITERQGIYAQHFLHPS